MHIKSNSEDPKKLWRSMSSVLRRDVATNVPPSLDVTAARLVQFFTDKVDVVSGATENAPVPPCTIFQSVQLTSFEDVTAEEVRKFILVRSPIKTCALDPLPTAVLREVVDHLLPFIWTMCNVFLKQRCLPPLQKAAIITPVLKKSDADPY